MEFIRYKQEGSFQIIEENISFELQGYHDFQGYNVMIKMAEKTDTHENLKLIEELIQSVMMMQPETLLHLTGFYRGDPKEYLVYFSRDEASLSKDYYFLSNLKKHISYDKENTRFIHVITCLERERAYRLKQQITDTFHLFFSYSECFCYHVKESIDILNDEFINEVFHIYTLTKRGEYNGNIHVTINGEPFFLYFHLKGFSMYRLPLTMKNKFSDFVISTCEEDLQGATAYHFSFDEFDRFQQFLLEKIEENELQLLFYPPNQFIYGLMRRVIGYRSFPNYLNSPSKVGPVELFNKTILLFNGFNETIQFLKEFNIYFQRIIEPKEVLSTSTNIGLKPNQYATFQFEPAYNEISFLMIVNYQGRIISFMIGDQIEEVYIDNLSLEKTKIFFNKFF